MWKILAKFQHIPSTMITTDPTVKVLNSLLRGELSAIETYSQVIHKFPDAAALSRLKAIRSDHLESVAVLRMLIKLREGDPDTDSGVWGSFAKAFEGAAALLGIAPALAALKQGEEHGVKEYQEAVNDDAMPAEVVAILESNLLPRLQSHVASLPGLAA